MRSATFTCILLFTLGALVTYSTVQAQSEKIAPLQTKQQNLAQQLAKDATKKKIVFVHGAWGGGWDYKVLENLLEAKGHSVTRVTLTGHGDRIHLMSGDINLDTHIMDVVNTIKYEDLDDFILVGHSYGGMVVTGVADRIPEKIKHLVYMDALLPLDGESVMNMQPEERQAEIMQAVQQGGDGIGIPPFWPDWEKTRVVHHPIGTWTQPISLNNQEAAAQIPTTYVLAYEESPETAGFKIYAERAKRRGWNYEEWQSHHNTQHHAIPRYVEFLDTLE